MPSAAAAFRRVVEVFDGLSIPYLVGGSVASSVHGIYRATNDVDFVAQFSERDIAPLVAELGAEFYADPEMMREALRYKRSFNLIHYGSSAKFDVFPLPDDPYSRSELARAAIEEATLAGAEIIRCKVASAEDTMLSKLVWYRAGGEQSELQWNDLRGLRAVRGSSLDRSYLEKWSRHLQVHDLLERLFAERQAT